MEIYFSFSILITNLHGIQKYLLTSTLEKRLYLFFFKCMDVTSWKNTERGVSYARAHYLESELQIKSNIQKQLFHVLRDRWNSLLLSVFRFSELIINFIFSPL